MSSQPVTLCVFVRAPNLGQVKSRLAAGSSEALALAAHVALMDRLVAQIGQWQSTNAKRYAQNRKQIMPVVQLWLAGQPESAQAQQLVALWQRRLDATVHQQQGADLGMRMWQAVLVNSGVPVVVVGTDCPGITPAYLSAAVTALPHARSVVLGPAEDGGYGLIGMATPQPTLFQEVAWGSAQVLPQTLERCEVAGLETKLLPTIWDVDEIHDWERYCREYPAT